LTKTLRERVRSTGTLDNRRNLQVKSDYNQRIVTNPSLKCKLRLPIFRSTKMSGHLENHPSTNGIDIYCVLCPLFSHYDRQYASDFHPWQRRNAYRHELKSI